MAYSFTKSGILMLNKACYMSSVISILLYIASCATVTSSIPITLPHVFYLRYICCT